MKPSLSFVTDYGEAVFTLHRSGINSDYVCFKLTSKPDYTPIAVEAWVTPDELMILGDMFRDAAKTFEVAEKLS